MELHNNPNLGTDLLEVKIRQVEDKIKTVTQDVGNIQNEVDSLHDDFDAQNVTVHTLPTREAIPSDHAVGFDRDGKLIPIDVAAGTAKWKSVEARQNIISPKDNADVLIDTSLILENTTEETMTDTEILGLDENGKIVKKDASETLQKKLVPGYNISIDEDTNEISCDIKTMTFKGSVATVEDLPSTGNTTGDVWNVTTTNQNYCWDGENWIIVGSSVDLTNYYTKTQTDSKFAEKSNTYTKSQTDSAIEGLIDDTVATTGNVWSASKTKTEIGEDTVIAYGSNAKGHYRKWKSGLIEQWGRISKGSNLAGGGTWDVRIDFPVSFSNTDYVFLPGSSTSSTTGYATGEEIATRNDNKSYATAKFYNRNGSNAAALPVLNWMAKGF